MQAPLGELAVKILRVSWANLRAVAVVLCCIYAAMLPARADPLDATCQQTGPDKRELECDVRFTQPRQVNSVTATVSDSARSLPTPTVDPYPGSGDVSAFLFLFDVSKSMRNDTLKANVDDARRIIRTAGPYDRFGVARSPGAGQAPTPNLDVLAGLDSDSNTVEHGFSSVERSFADGRLKGAQSSVYLSSIEAIRLLGDFHAKRRALLLFAAGKSEGETYTLDTVVAEAKNLHVSVFTFGVEDHTLDTRPLQPFVQLADLTEGHYYQAIQPNPHFATADLDTALKYIDNGGRVKVDLTGLTSDQTVELAFSTTGNPSRLTYRTLVQGLPAVPASDPKTVSPPSPPVSPDTVKPTGEKPDPVKPPAGKPTPDATSPGWFQTLETWILGHELESILAGVGLVICLLAFITYRMTRGRGQVLDTPPSVAAFSPVSPSREETSRMRPGVAPTVAVDERSQSTPLATLQPVMAGGSPHVVRNAMVTIGRASDCDIRLSDDTVSAHHATLVHKRDGSFELTDMGSRNGVRVNGERVERRMVSNGDRIELGAAQFRFVLN